MANPDESQDGSPLLPEVVVVGICRNVETTVGREVLRLKDAIEGIGFSPHFFLVESDSTDNSRTILISLQKSIPSFSFVSLGNLEVSIPNRIERLRFCRNRYVWELRNNETFQNAIYTFVVDFDIKNSALNLKGFSVFLTQEYDWSAVFCNQKGRYYDIYALREATWSPDDCFKSAFDNATKLGWEKARQVSIWSRMKKIKPSEDIISVDSAFGGLGIYKYSVFERFDYTITAEVANYESEHIALHYKLRRVGGRLYILPSLTNFSWNAHNLSSFKFFRTLDSLSQTRRLKWVRQVFRKRIS